MDPGIEYFLRETVARLAVRNYSNCLLFKQYDIRIWYEVYNAAIRQAKDEAKKEKMKRKLYARENEPEDEELSLEAIKSRVPLKRMINRRYREFMELHNRLTAGKLGIHMKGMNEAQSV